MSVADLQGRLQIRTLKVAFEDTGAFKVYVSNHGRDDFIHTFSAKTLGALSSILGQGGIETGDLRVPVMSRNTQSRITLVSTQPTPATFLSASWEGYLVKRNQTIN
jgi:hypothetical protein